uniref:hypothetical protein n=1 Tax=Enterococcus faecium TaxID=1352 RepID=UPI00292CAD02
NRDKFSQSVQEVASVDLAKMGLIIVSFTIKEVRDKNGYLDSLEGPTVDSTFDYEEFRNYLDGIGDSLLVVNDDEIIKVHVHTEN